MTLVTLKDVLQPALAEGYAVAGVVTLGWEDMRAYVAAAEAENVPLILQAGPGCRAHTPLPILGKMFVHLAEEASVPIVAHLDHGTSFEECKIAVDCGFTSLMFDGSKLPFYENVEETSEVSALARSASVSCEGEIGFVGYAAGQKSHGTDPEEAANFARETRVDAMAVSVGNVHLQEDAQTHLNKGLVEQIEARCDTPLVIHGGSGVNAQDRSYFARNSNICKFNIGTELRQAFGRELRSALANDSVVFDRIDIMKTLHGPLVAATRNVLKGLKPA